MPITLLLKFSDVVLNPSQHHNMFQIKSARRPHIAQTVIVELVYHGRRRIIVDESLRQRRRVGSDQGFCVNRIRTTCFLIELNNFISGIEVHSKFI